MSSRFDYKKTKSSLYERQNVKYLLPYLLIIVFMLTLGAGALEKYVTGKGLAGMDIAVWVYILLFVFIPLPLLAMLILSRLDTIVDEDGVLYRWAPYHKQFHLLHWSAIKEVVLLDLKPEGLLWRWKRKNHKRFFPGGRYAFEVRLRNGNTILLGTRKPEEMHRALTRNAGDKFNMDASTVIFDYT